MANCECLSVRASLLLRLRRSKCAVLTSFCQSEIPALDYNVFYHPRSMVMVTIFGLSFAYQVSSPVLCFSFCAENLHGAVCFCRFKEKQFGSSGATSGLSSSLAFTPVQVCSDPVFGFLLTVPEFFLSFFLVVVGFIEL